MVERRRSTCAVVLVVCATIFFDTARGQESRDKEPGISETRGVSSYRNHQQSFDLINRSTNLLGWGNPHPVAVVRAVNHLHSLGKDGAVETLRAYVRYAPIRGSWIDDVNSSDQQRLCWIIPLLFVPKKAGANLPDLGRLPARNRSNTGWQPFYISVHGDLPFHNVNFVGRTGSPEPSRNYLVDWAADHAELRKSPLRPVDDPLKAADELCELLVEEDRKTGDDRGMGRDGNGRSHIRQQAWRTVSHLIASERNKDWPGWMLDDSWHRLREETKELRFRWNEKTQEYVAD